MAGPMDLFTGNMYSYMFALGLLMGGFPRICGNAEEAAATAGGDGTIISQAGSTTVQVQEIYLGVNIIGLGLVQSLVVTQIYSRFRKPVTKISWILLPLDGKELELQEFINNRTANFDFLVKAAVTQLNYELKNQNTLFLAGNFLDDAKVQLCAQALKAAYLSTHSEYLSTLTDYNVVIPRVDTILGPGDVGMVATKLLFWNVYYEDDKVRYVSPDDLTPPSNDVIIAELTKVGLTNVEIYNKPAWRNLESNGFKLYVHGLIEDSDVQEFGQKLEAVWSKKQGYEDSRVITSLRDTYVSESSLEKTTALVYFVEKSDKTLVNVAEVKFDAEKELETELSMMKRENGSLYELDIDIRTSLDDADHIVSSTNTSFRLRECFQLVVEGRVVESTLPEMQARLESAMHSSGDASFAKSEVKIVHTETLANQDRLFTKVYFTVTATQNSKEKVVNALRTESAAASEEQLVASLQTLSKPDNKKYQFNTERAVADDAVAMEDCFSVIVEGPVLQEDRTKFAKIIEDRIKEIKTGMTVEVKIEAVLEVIVDGKFSSQLWYSVTKTEETDSNLKSVVSAATSGLNLQILTAELQAKIYFKHPDGTPYKLVKQTEDTKVTLKEDTLTLYLNENPIQKDKSTFAEKIKEILKSKSKVSPEISSTIEVEVVAVDKYFTKEWKVRYQVSYVVESKQNVVIPGSIVEVTAAEYVDGVKVTTPAGRTYSVITDQCDQCERSSDAFKLSFSTDVAFTNEQTLLEKLVDVVKETRPEYKDKEVICKFVGIEEVISMSARSSTDKTSYVVSVKVTIDRRDVSSRKEQVFDGIKVAEKCSQVKNPQGVSYIVSMELSTMANLKTLEYVNEIVLENPIREDDMREVAEAINKIVTAQLSELEEMSIIVIIPRQKELMSKTGSKWSCGFEVYVDGQPMHPLLIPNMDRAILTAVQANIDDATSPGRYTVAVDITLEETVTFSKTYSLTCRDSMMLESNYQDICEVITETLKETVAEYANKNLECLGFGTDEVIDKLSGESYFNFKYTVSIDWELLDGSVDYLPDVEMVKQKASQKKITDINEEEYTYVSISLQNASPETIRSTDVVRRSQCVEIIVNKYSSMDSAAVETAIKKSVIRSARLEVAVTVVQTLKIYTESVEYTKMICEVTFGEETVSAITIGQLDIAEVKASLDAEATKVEEYIVKSESDLTEAVVVEARHCFSFTLDTPCLVKDVKDIEANLGTAYAEKHGTGQTISDVNILQVEEKVLKDIRQSVFTCVYTMEIDGKRAKSSTTKTITEEKLKTVLDIKIEEDSAAKYSEAIITAKHQVSSTKDQYIEQDNLHMLFVKEMIPKGQFEQIEEVLNEALKATDEQYKDCSTKVIGQERVTVDGVESFCLKYTVELTITKGSRIVSKLLAMIDVKSIEKSVIETKLKEKAVKTARGEDYTVNDITKTTKIVQEKDLYKCTFSDDVQEYDIAAVESAFKGACIQSFSSGTMTVKFVSTKEIIKIATGHSEFEALFEVEVDGKLLSALQTGQCSMQSITTALQSAAAFGSSGTYADLLVSVRSSIFETSAASTSNTEMAVEYNSCASLLTREVMLISLKEEMEKVLAEVIRQDASNDIKSTSEVKVQMVKTEDVITETREVFSKTSIIVIVDGVFRDAHSLNSIDVTQVDLTIEANAALKEKVTLEKTVQVKNTKRLEKAFMVLVKNEVTKKDMDNMAKKLQEKYRSELGSAGFSSVTVTAIVKKEIVSSKGFSTPAIFRPYTTSLTNVAFFIEKDGKVIKQSISEDAVEASLTGLELKSGEILQTYQAVDSVELFSYEKTFKSLFSASIINEDQARVEAAIKQKFAQKLGVEEAKVSIDILRVEEVLTKEENKGKTYHQAVYGIKLDSSQLDSRGLGQLTAAEMISTLASVQISNTNKNFDDIIVDESPENVVRKSHIGQITLEQLCLTSQLPEFRTVLEEAIKAAYTVMESSINILAQDQNDVTCTVLAIEHMISKKIGLFASSGVFTLYFESSVEEAYFYNEEFINNVQDKLTSKKASLVTSKGAPYTVLKVKPSDIYKKSTSFHIDLSITLVNTDSEKICNALQVSYKSAHNEDATCQLTWQEELISVSDQKTIWRQHLLFIVNGIYLDNRVDKFLTDQQIQILLATVKISTSPGNQMYDSVYVTSSTEAYEYESRFSMLFKTEVATEQFSVFETALKTTLKGEVSEFSSKTVIVDVVKVEEVVDISGMFHSDLSFFVKVDGTLLDGRSIIGLSTESITQMISTASLKMKNGMSFQAAGVVNQPTMRMEHSLKDFLVKGLVPEGSNPDFEAAIQKVYSKLDGLSEVKCTVIIQDVYIHEGEYATSLVAFLDVHGLLVNPSTVAQVDFTSIQQEITFKSTTTQEQFVLIDITEVNMYELLRYKNAFAVTLQRTVQTMDLQPIVAKLLEEWKKVMISEASDLEVLFGMQEEIFVTEGETSESFWKMTYFVKSKHGLVNAKTSVHLSEEMQMSAFDMEITGSSPVENYKDAIVTIPKAAEVHKMSVLFSIMLYQKASSTQYTQFQNSIEIAFKKSHPEYTDVSVRVEQQIQYISKIGEIIWCLLFSTSTTNNKLLMSKDFAPLPKTVIEVELQFKSPRGVDYAVSETKVVDLFRTESSFSFYLTRAVLTVDETSIKEKFTQEWRVKRTDLINLQIELFFVTEAINMEGNSVYKCSSVVTAETGQVNSMFEAGISSDQITNALSKVTITGSRPAETYNSKKYNGNVAKLVSFQDLITIAITTRVSESDYEAITNIIKQAWTDISSDYSKLDINVRTQEDYLNEQGDFLAVLLYSASLNNNILGIEDLPSLESSKLTGIQNIIGPTEDPYELAAEKIGQLTRYKNTMCVYTSSWIANNMVETFNKAIKETIVEMGTIQGEVTVKKVTQEWHVKEGEEVVKYVFLVHTGSTQLDGAREEVIDQNKFRLKLTDMGMNKVLALSTQADYETTSLRTTYQLFVKGPVADNDLLAFSERLTIAWLNIQQGLSLRVVHAEEYIGESSLTVTRLCYEVKNGQITLDPLMVTGPSEADLISEVKVTSFKNIEYELYFSEASRKRSMQFDVSRTYSKQYRLHFMGTVTTADAESIVPNLEDLWKEQTGKSNVDVEITKTETVYASYGITLTRVSYAVTIEMRSTFPLDVAPPSNARVTAALDETAFQMYSSPSDIIIEEHRAEKLFSMLVEGPVNKSSAAGIVQALTEAHGALFVSSIPTIAIVGTESLVAASDTSISLTRILYSLTHGLDKIYVAPFNAATPKPNVVKQNVETVAKLALAAADTLALKIRTIELKGYYSRSQETAMTSGIKAAYVTMAGTSATSANTEVVVFSSENHFCSASWIHISSVSYAVKVNGKDPADVIGVVLPGRNYIGTKLNEEDSSLKECECQSKRAYSHNVKGTTNDLQTKANAIQAALEIAWQLKNPDIPAQDLKVDLRLASSRQRRQVAENENTVTDVDGNPVSEIEYKVNAGPASADADSIHMATPSDMEVSNALQDVGVELFEGALQKCGTWILVEHTTDAQKDDVIEAIKAAYIKTNSEVTTDNFIVVVKEVNNQNRVDGNPVSEVIYCTSYADGGNVRDLRDPSQKEKSDALSLANRKLAEDGAFAKLSSNKTWSLIVASMCGVIALLLVLIAFTIVCIRHSSQNNKMLDSDKPMYDEIYAGHANYKANIYDNPINFNYSWDRSKFTGTLNHKSKA